jgi:hypothetical protein
MAGLVERQREASFTFSSFPSLYIQVFAKHEPL